MPIRDLANSNRGSIADSLSSFTIIDALLISDFATSSSPARCREIPAATRLDSRVLFEKDDCSAAFSKRNDARNGSSEAIAIKPKWCIIITSAFESSDRVD